jgi:prepilin-type N-terminal cleavage/methylation domain-containing protein
MIKKIRSSKAFTLIEMLIVVAIIGILVGVGVPALRNARADAQEQKRNSVLANVTTAKARFELDNNVSAITAYNALTDEDDRFDEIKQYLVVNGVQPANVTALIQGTGYDNTPSALAFGDMTTYNTDGTVNAAVNNGGPEAPSFSGNVE